MFLSNGALRISSAAVEDAGMYECKAVSVAGNATKVITLYVQGRCAFLLKHEILKEKGFKEQ